MAITKGEGESYTRRLALVFLLWKTLLLTLAAFCPGPGYDTSALILLDPSANRHKNFSQLSWTDRLTLNLFRWDALYFVKAAERGKIHEQEWAFSWAYSKLLGFVAQCKWSVLFTESVVNDRTDLTVGPGDKSHQYIVAGVVLSNVAHLLSVVVLYRLLTMTVDSRQRQQISFIGAILHILTPASLFLSAPYTEALFSLLNLTGMLLYVQSRIGAQSQHSSVQEDAYKLGSGIMFSVATLMRSNGLLSGLVLLYDVGRYLPRVVSMQLTMHDVRRIFVTCMAGTVIAMGFVWPQYLAYIQFCNGDRSADGPPWCSKAIPSIFTWVQSHYWNVGLFRYWTLPNLPLFLMAAPMLWLMLTSSVTVLRTCVQPHLCGRPVPRGSATDGPNTILPVTHHASELALPQLVLAVAAATSFHVQIVNRIASGYPTWYSMVATWLVSNQTESSSSKNQKRSQWIVRGMIVYAIAQGMLFANFLPPA